jgi:hypothetical protein
MKSFEPAPLRGAKRAAGNFGFGVQRINNSIVVAGLVALLASARSI